MSQSDFVPQHSRHAEQGRRSARQRRTHVRQHHVFAGRSAMHIVRVRIPPAELATRLTEPRFPAQRSKSAGSDWSLVTSGRMHRVSVHFFAANITSIAADITLIDFDVA
jgi:hypothetical protein